MARTDAGLRQAAEAREQMLMKSIAKDVFNAHTSVPMRQPKLSEPQQTVIWKMQHGRELVKHPMHCGDPSSFWLGFPDEMGDKADKRTVDALIKRGFIVFSERRDRFAIYRLTALGRQVVCLGG